MSSRRIVEEVKEEGKEVRKVSNHGDFVVSSKSPRVMKAIGELVKALKSEKDEETEVKDNKLPE